MFRNQINNPIDPIPVEYVSTLKRLYNEPDYSLTCYGIAMLRNRCDYKGINGIYWIEHEINSCITKFDLEIKDRDDEPYFGYFIYTNKDNFNDEPLTSKGFKRKTPIEKLINDKSGHDCFAYYHEEQNTAAVFINSRDIRLYHLLISFIPLYYPALFKDKPMTPEEYEIVKTLSKNDGSLFVNRIKEAMEPYVEEFRRLQIGKLIQQMHEVKIASAKANVDSAKTEVENYYDCYLNAIERLKEYIVYYEGTKATQQTDEKDDELVEFLCTNKDIRCIKIEDNKISFISTSLLVNYNEDAWRSFDERDGIYDGDYKQRDCGFNLCEVFESKKNRKLLLNSIFGENPEFAVKMCGFYKLNLSNNGAFTSSGYRYTEKDQSLENYLPNPHLQLHGCLGGYTSRITECLQRGNYISAIDLCVASAGSVNLDETDLTFRPFLGYIMSSTKKILRRNDGVDMTPEEALIYLVDKEKENEAD